MAFDPSNGMGGFLQGMLGDLLKMVKTDSPMQWELAQQFANSIASDSAQQHYPEPKDRIRIEQILSLVQRHVADVTGMTVTPPGSELSVITTTRAEWARRSLEMWRPLIEQIAGELNPSVDANTSSEIEHLGADEDAQDAKFGAFLSKWTAAVAPMMVSMQIGSVVGHLAQRALSQYELLLPRSPTNEIIVIPENVAAFADEWSLPLDELSLWLTVRDVTMTAVMSRPHVALRISDLLVRHAGGFRADPSALQETLGGAFTGETGDLSDVSKLLGNPAALREIAMTPELKRVTNELSALSATIDGYAEWVTTVVAERINGTTSLVHEALRRHRVARGEQAQTADLLFGLATDQAALDRGEAFVRGVLDRDGHHELAQLWVVEANLPTPAEVDAPGLWIERVNLPDAGAL